MFAIELTEDNLSKILRELNLTRPVDVIELQIYAESDSEWHIVRGYVDSRGRVGKWTVLPTYILTRSYQYDPDKTKTDWDLIVRN